MKTRTLLLSASLLLLTPEFAGADKDDKIIRAAERTAAAVERGARATERTAEALEGILVELRQIKRRLPARRQSP